MDNGTANQLSAAIQALATAATAPPVPPAPPAAPMAPPPPDFILPYEGHALDLFSCTGMSLFQKGCETLASKFMSKVEDLHLFLTNLNDCAETCHWNSATHGILAISVPH